MSSAGKKVEKEFGRIDNTWKKATGGTTRLFANAMTLGLAEPFYFQPQKAQQQANKQARASQQAAANQLKQAERDFNRANPKAADIMQLLLANRRAGATGSNSTFLTGAQGLTPGSLQLGGSSLLGS